MDPNAMPSPEQPSSPADSAPPAAPQAISGAGESRPKAAAPRASGSPLDEALEREIASALGDVNMSDLVDLAGSQEMEAKRGDRGGGQAAGTRRGPAPRQTAKRGKKSQGREGRRGGHGGHGGHGGRGMPRPERQVRVGRVHRIHDGDVFVEFGAASQGVCPLVQFGDAPPEVGAEIEFMIERMDAFEGLLVLSLPGATQKADWDHLEVGQVVEARCIGMNKGGLEMELAHHKAFMPAGQVDLRHVPDISIYLGQKFPCQIIELRREKGRIILSRRAALAEERARKKDEVIATLEEGQQVRATITSIQPYGAFADIGGVDGLIHIADLAHERLKHPSEVVKVGDEVEVKILRIDRAQDPPKIALGRKQVMADPILQKLTEIQPGATVTGRVTRLTDFGAFVEIAAGLEGLVHISEVSHDRIPSVDRVLKRDQIVTAKVLSVDSDRKRVSLSIKALEARPERPGRPGRGDEIVAREDGYLRDEDPVMRKLKARFSASGGLKGGIG